MANATQNDSNAAPKAVGDKTIEITGEVYDFHVGGTSGHRLYMVATLPFGKLREIVEINTFNAETGRGEQRTGIEPWQNKLSRAMEDGTFTPAPWSATVRPSHIKDQTVKAGQKLTLRVSKRQPLSLIDGQQRMGGMTRLYNRSEPDQQKIINSCPVTLPIFLDPTRVKQDFIALQQGRPVDTTHMVSLRLQAHLMDEKKEPFMKVAWGAAKELQKNDQSPFFGSIKFDSGSSAVLAFSSLATMGGSDIGTSIYGGAKIAMEYKRDSDWLAQMYIAAYQGIKKHGSKEEIKDPVTGKVSHETTLFLSGKWLCPPSHGGKKGNASLLVGVGIMLAFRMAHLGRDEPTAKDLKFFAEKAEEIFDGFVNGNLSGPTKRQLIGNFAREYFRDIMRLSEEDEANKTLLDQQDGVPLALVQLLSKSTLDVDKDAAINGYPKSRPATDDEFEPEETSEDTSEAGDEMEQQPTFEELEDESEDESEDDFTPPPPQKTGRAARGSAPATRGRKVEPIEA